MSNDVEGLYFIGLPWLYTRGSATLGGVWKDAQYLMTHIQKNQISGIADPSAELVKVG